jgi:hypothetical protein
MKLYMNAKSEAITTNKRTKIFSVDYRRHDWDQKWLFQELLHLRRPDRWQWKPRKSRNVAALSHHDATDRLRRM